MRHVIVRYRVKPDRVAENEALVRAVYDELRRAKPEGFRYATYKLEDGVTFVHVATSERADGSTPLSESAAFAEFQREIRDRCEEPPAASTGELVGAYA